MSRINVANFRHPDATADSITVTSDGDTQINRALGLGGATYGSSGQVLTSQGSGSAPQWASVSTGNNYNFQSGSASGSSILIPSIPTNATQIVVVLGGIGWSTSAQLFLRLGDSSSITSTAGHYTWSTSFHGSSQAADYYNNLWDLNYGFTGTNERMYGTVTLNRLTNNGWVGTYTAKSTNSQAWVLTGAGWGYSGSSNPVEQLQLAVSAGSMSTGSYTVNVYTE